MNNDTQHGLNVRVDAACMRGVPPDQMICHIAVKLWEEMEEAHHFKAVGNAHTGQQAAAVLIKGIHIVVPLPGTA
ncbi:hypothetical protein E2C01_011646 [Portunus trituberculatus]|uniref:Uncharacterized protein n=1 Tax=Portunus trituberculatus TaxID=210409 RepID=A0A5B7DBL8_PORTR|nr:hypothetical protein [Portunus trituberculatus]